MFELSPQNENPMLLYCDNKLAISITHNPTHHDHTKHIEVDRHFIKEKIEEELVCLPYITSKGQLAFEEELVCLPYLNQRVTTTHV